MLQEILWLDSGDTIIIRGTSTQIQYNTSGKNHFHEMNGDVGMAGWK